jgi:uncharacterized membrane protein YkvA (DUF1232 family)
MSGPGGIEAAAPWPWRFPAALVLLIVASLCFGEGSGPGPFRLALAACSAVVSFLVVSTLCWQWRILGDPWRPRPALLHGLLFVAVLLLTSALFRPAPDTQGLVANLLARAAWLTRTISLVPQEVFDVLRSPGILLLVIGVGLALCLPRPVAEGALVLATCAAVGTNLAGRSAGEVPWLVAGLACLGGALWIQYEDPGERRFWEAVLAEWRTDPVLAGDLELKVRLLSRLRRSGRPLSEHECAGLIARALGPGATADEALAVTRRVVGQLVLADALAVHLSTRDGAVIDLARDPASPADALAAAAVLPRAALLALVAAVWVASPIDVWPDQLPLGAVDDALVTLLALAANWEVVASFLPRGARAAARRLARGAGDDPRRIE